MGQKVNPHGARVGIIKGWDSRWFADKKEMAANIKEDVIFIPAPKRISASPASVSP